MKSTLFIKLVNGKFSLVEQKMVVAETELALTENYADLAEIITTAGYKNAKASPEAKAAYAEMKKAMRLASDVKRQERIAKQKAKLEAQIAKSQEKLAKLV